MNTINETLNYILKAIIPESDQVSTEEHQEGDMSILEITAPQEVVGRIIGKEGKIIKSIRTILNLSFPQTRFLIKIKE
jgi:predicted RNA-binding protein YlqC (UPF0109 family)